MNPQEVAKTMAEWRAQQASIPTTTEDGTPVQGRQDPNLSDHDLYAKLYGSSPASMLLGLAPTKRTSNAGYWSDEGNTGGRMEDGSIDQMEADRSAMLNRQKAMYTDANGVFTPPKSIFGDLSKFSKNGTGNINDYFSQVENGRGRGGAELIDPKKVYHDPNYGTWTPRNNLKQLASDSDSGFMGQLGKYAPMAIQATMGAATMGAAGPLIGGAIMAGNQAMGQLATGGHVDFKNMGKNAILSYLASVVPGLGQAKSAYDIYKQFHH
jgi:hypothetical protein